MGEEGSDLAYAEPGSEGRLDLPLTLPFLRCVVLDILWVNASHLREI